jgi:hypothetical protein
MNDMNNNMMHARSVRSHKLRKQLNYMCVCVYVTNTYYTIALLCTCARIISAQTLTV